SRKNVRFAVVHSAGFSELGAEGKKLEEEMLRFARQSGTRIVGPNCMGIYSPTAAINTIAAFSDEQINETGPVAFVGQSGWVTENVIQMGYERGLRFSKVVSIGNQSDLTIEDMLEYFAHDADTRVIGFYVEGLKQAKRFFRLAGQVSQSKPIIVWKAGRTNAGSRVVASHTASIAGNNVVVDAALMQSGATIARNLDELMDLMVGFTSPSLPRGNKLGLLVEAGGGAVAGADSAEALGFEIPLLSAQAQKEIIEELKSLSLPFSNLKNPVDLVWSPGENAVQVLTQCARIISREVDAIVMISYTEVNDNFAQAFRQLIDETGKPVFLLPGHPGEHRNEMSLLTRNGIPTFIIPDRAIKTLQAMLRYSKNRLQD
ncbi:MAG: hypothetical protein HY665_09100, partial [Chloroflexi bacterium]|nr:hypothetical protein [Chloroflexota bacterium]